MELKKAVEQIHYLANWLKSFNDSEEVLALCKEHNLTILSYNGVEMTESVKRVFYNYRGAYNAHAIRNVDRSISSDHYNIEFIIPSANAEAFGIKLQKVLTTPVSEIRLGYIFKDMSDEEEEEFEKFENEFVKLAQGDRDVFFIDYESEYEYSPLEDAYVKVVCPTEYLDTVNKMLGR